MEFRNAAFGYTRRNVRDTARRPYFMRITAHNQLDQDMLKCDSTISARRAPPLDDDRYRRTSGSNLVINVVPFASSRRERRHFKGLSTTAAAKGRYRGYAIAELSAASVASC